MGTVRAAKGFDVFAACIVHDYDAIVAVGELESGLEWYCDWLDQLGMASRTLCWG